MKFYIPVSDYSTGEPFLPSIEGDDFTERLMKRFAGDFSPMTELASSTSIGASFRAGLESVIEDRGDPVQSGWTYVIHEKDPQKDELIALMEPLARVRGMPNPTEPLLFDGRDPDEWNDWIEESFPTLDGKKRPYYFLLLGGPEHLPFALQSYLDVTSAVGRIAFDTLADYRTYVAKAVRRAAEDAKESLRSTLIFATDGGPSDPTYYSREYMAKPLASHAKDTLGVPTTTLFGGQATRKNLTAELRKQTPALLYTASHGVGAFTSDEATQRSVNGAIQCQRDLTAAPGESNIFAAADVPLDTPFLEDSIFFQFACLGYGTPAESDFAHWYPEIKGHKNSQDFIAALPKRLAAHPNGPVAYVGHVDLAFLQGFTDADAPDLMTAWHSRIEPFANAFERLLAGQPVGLALEYMNARQANLASAIVTNYDRLKRGKIQDTPKFRMNLARTYVQLNDSRNYMIFGDPAARLRLAS